MIDSLRLKLLITALYANLALMTACHFKTSQNEDDVNIVSTKTYILVHGAWHGAWCWRDVKLSLESIGHKVFTPDLTGLGDRADELDSSTGLETHIEDVLKLIDDNQLDNIILIGHSYGGMVVTGVADRRAQKIDHLVYLDAVVPSDGRSMINAHSSVTYDMAQAIIDELSQLSVDGIALSPFKPEIFGVPQDHPKYSWVEQNLTPHPMKTWTDNIVLSNPPLSARTFIHAIDPVIERSTIPIFAAEAKSSKDWQYYELNTGHDIMVTEPESLVQILLDI